MAHVDADDNADQRSVDAGNRRSDPLLASAPIPGNWLPMMMPTKAESVMMRLITPA
jgi:hypothetical protein